MSLVYPFPVNKTFIYYSFNGNQQTGDYEYMTHEPWADGRHFTIRHRYGSTGTPAPWCPRVDDVFLWDGSQLIYSDTYDFYKNEIIHYSNPGHIWARNPMPAAQLFSNYMDGTLYSLNRDSGCNVLNYSVLNSNIRDRVWSQVIENQQTWSPFTGGPGMTVNSFRLDETTYLNNDPADTLKEEWYFYDHPVYGYIALQTRGYRKTQSDQVPLLAWDERLTQILG